MNEKVDFGYQKVARSAKQNLVQEIFTDVAPKYDLMNNFMSFGLHNGWKEVLLKEISPTEGDCLIDVAGGTGDIAGKFIEHGGLRATVVDLNKAMLEAGQAKISDDRIDWVHANAEELPFASNSFDYYTISFGIRNVTNIPKALKEAFRVLKPMGKFLCLEFSQVNTPIVKEIYDYYSFKVIPKIGKFVADNEDAYRYLVESIKKFEPAPRFSKLIEQAGFENVEYTKLSLGVVAIHVGYKLG